MSAIGRPFDVICCSLEPWDQVWRRNQFLTEGILRQRPGLRVLFVELPVDVTWSLLHRQALRPTKLRPVGESGRLWAVAPRKWLPRRVWPGGDKGLVRQVLAAARTLGFSDPVLWINDNTYSDLVRTSGWPSVYDVTDDWLLAPHPPREMARQMSNDSAMLAEATEVVVCSPALASTRGRNRPVHLIPNGVDLDHFRRPQPRPTDLPPGPVVLYQGSITDGRLDVPLSIDICVALTGRATFVLVGPNSLSAASTRKMLDAGAVFLGPRGYEELPGYLQSADVLVVPHAVNPFTESLDPIKAREFLAVGRPTVTTPVAGFRELGPPIRVRSGRRFIEELELVLGGDGLPPGPGPLLTRPPAWSDRAEAFLAVLDEAFDRGSKP